MKVLMNLKDPDGVYESIRSSAEDSVNAIEGLDESERECLVDTRIEKIESALNKWIKYGEYVAIEFDLEKNEAKVVAT